MDLQHVEPEHVEPLPIWVEPLAVPISPPAGVMEPAPTAPKAAPKAPAPQKPKKPKKCDQPLTPEQQDRAADHFERVKKLAKILARNYGLDRNEAESEAMLALVDAVKGQPTSASWETYIEAAVRYRLSKLRKGWFCVNPSTLAVLASALLAGAVASIVSLVWHG